MSPLLYRLSYAAIGLAPQGSSSHKVLLLETLFPFMQHYNTMSVKIVLSKRKQSISNIYWVISRWIAGVRVHKMYPDSKLLTVCTSRLYSAYRVAWLSTLWT